MFKKSVSVLLLLSLNAFAQESLQSKIQRLQSVSKAERFQLMNEIKRELVTLHGDQRREAVGKLREHLGQGADKTHDGSGKRVHNGNGEGKYRNDQQQQKYRNDQQQQNNSGAGENKNQQPQHGQRHR